MSQMQFSLLAKCRAGLLSLSTMNNWFYAHDGEQKGPVSQEELARLAASGHFAPAKDLVWREGMSDWKKVAEVPELNLNPPSTPAQPAQPTQATAVPGAAATNDPYQTPAASSYIAEATGEDDLPEIEPGTSPIGISECISRAFELTKRHFGILLAVWAIYFGISFAVGMVLGLVEIMVGVASQSGSSSYQPGSSTTFTEPNANPAGIVVNLLTNIISQAVSIFLTLGVTRFGLNFLAGRKAEIGMMFGEGSKFLRTVGAAILFGLMVAVGLVFLIVPGIYLALRFGQYQNAIVDRDMGVFDAFRYSSSLTQNNKMSLLGLSILLGLINLGGMLALCIGLFFTVPLTWLASLIAYRWLQHGPAALEERGLLRDAAYVPTSTLT